MVKEALVVKREILFKDKYFEGFMPEKEYDYTFLILNNFHYHQRGDELEHNEALQQIIPYVWIVNLKTKKIFAYRRANNEKYAEKRLRNKWSCGVGGHIDKEDVENPMINAMMRELREEVKMLNYPQPKIIGYLNDDKGDVEKVHFGVVAIAETEEEVKKGDEEMAEGGFYHINELERMMGDKEIDFEGWTRISWPFVKEYLQKA